MEGSGDGPLAMPSIQEGGSRSPSPGDRMMLADASTTSDTGVGRPMQEDEDMPTAGDGAIPSWPFGGNTLTEQDLADIQRFLIHRRTRAEILGDRRKAAHGKLRESKLRWWLKIKHPELYHVFQSQYLQNKKLKTWFDFIDADGSGEIDVDELEDPLTSLGLATTRDEVQRLVDAVDDDKSGEIGFEEFVKVINTGSGTRNPIKKLYVSLAQGRLGDPALHLSVLIAAYRRSVILKGLSAYANPERTRDHIRSLRSVHALRGLMDRKALVAESEDDGSVITATGSMTAVSHVDESIANDAILSMLMSTVSDVPASGPVRRLTPPQHTASPLAATAPPGAGFGSPPRGRLSPVQAPRTAGDAARGEMDGTASPGDKAAPPAVAGDTWAAWHEGQPRPRRGSGSSNRRPRGLVHSKRLTSAGRSKLHTMAGSLIQGATKAGKRNLGSGTAVSELDPARSYASRLPDYEAFRHRAMHKPASAVIATGRPSRVSAPVKGKNHGAANIARSLAAAMRSEDGAGTGRRGGSVGSQTARSWAGHEHTSGHGGGRRRRGGSRSLSSTPRSARSTMSSRSGGSGRGALADDEGQRMVPLASVPSVANFRKAEKRRIKRLTQSRERKTHARNVFKNQAKVAAHQVVVSTYFADSKVPHVTTVSVRDGEAAQVTRPRTIKRLPTLRSITSDRALVGKFVPDCLERTNRHLETINLNPKLSCRYRAGEKRRQIPVWQRANMGLATGSWGYLNFAQHKAEEEAAQQKEADARGKLPARGTAKHKERLKAQQAQRAKTAHRKRVRATGEPVPVSA